MRDLRSVDLNLLVALDALLDERSVRGAARRLHLTPPAMSHQLRRIRDLLDDEVLVRAGRGMVATPRAEALIEPVRALLAQAQQVLESPARFSPESSQRAFRLVCTDHVATVLLPIVEQLLAQEAPGVDMHLCPVLPEMMEQLRTGAVDVAIRVVESTLSGLRAHTLFDERYVTVVRQDHPRLRGPGVTLDEFLAEAHVLVAPGGVARGPIDALLEAAGRERRIARTRPNFLSALWLVCESDMVLTVGRRVVEAVAERLPVRVLPTPLPVEDYELSMLWHPRLDGSVADLWFRELLQRAASRL